MKTRTSLVFVCVLACAMLVVTPAVVSAQSEADILRTMIDINNQLAASGEQVKLVSVEYFTAKDEAGQIVYFDDRTKQSGAHWVPGDPRRGGFLDIAWLSDQTQGTANGVSSGDTQAAVSRAMDTWDNMKCATIPLVQLPDYGLDWGYVQYLIGYGGVPGWLADITQAGWLPGFVFDFLFGPGSGVVGATFTFSWINTADGSYTDIDNNGKEDVAFREIYYNNYFPWGIDTSDPIDVETIVLHETGHGLSLGHFGKLFRTDRNGYFHFAPRALMNAGYTGVQQTVDGTDNAAFCSVWGSWPNN